jgi:hypothetical protein
LEELAREHLGTGTGGLDQALIEARRRAPGLTALPPGHSAAAGLGGFDYAWRVEDPADIPSDGAWHSVPLAEGEGPASPAFVCVPRESAEVFRTLRFSSPLRGPLLSAPMDVYVAGSWLLTVDLAPLPPGAELSLGLGVEQGLKVARNARFEEKTTGLIVNSLELHHDIEVELQNHLGRAASLELRERLPVAAAGEDEVQVVEGAVTPPWEPWERPEAPVEGARRWRLRLEPGERKVLRAHYSVRIPSKHELVGGNRREP